MSLSLNSYYKGSRGRCGAGGLYEGVPSAHLDKPPLSRCIKKYIYIEFFLSYTQSGLVIFLKAASTYSLCSSREAAVNHSGRQNVEQKESLNVALKLLDLCYHGKKVKITL